MHSLPSAVAGAVLARHMRTQLHHACCGRDDVAIATVKGLCAAATARYRAEHLLLHLVLLDDALHVAVHLEVLHHLCQPTRHQPSA
jgi:hypothetical protein